MCRRKFRSQNVALYWRRQQFGPVLLLVLVRLTPPPHLSLLWPSLTSSSGWGTLFDQGSLPVPSVSSRKSTILVHAGGYNPQVEADRCWKSRIGSPVLSNFMTDKVVVLVMSTITSPSDFRPREPILQATLRIPLGVENLMHEISETDSCQEAQDFDLPWALWLERKACLTACLLLSVAAGPQLVRTKPQCMETRAMHGD
ncbi:uncharacterized protein MYCFIDRAFT_173874 [Pseudocercospora fijiensis CIRAD86]|uniref:Uncharacterized protein n=1 Tax=Pseudocercospora fijiensis (strain CIRAD86) TaxID=383855 RepID=M3B6N6_PSEFD|nr:uncharacterized protein MYCFIDRAFT_173874 [Pseudocercospora fijiensis CIRAD86]EME85003.1 hypothetical protein MYCFIDRAFT_173874 [Pseudocercospora fijiensis CIRAD86]